MNQVNRIIWCLVLFMPLVVCTHKDAEPAFKRTVTEIDKESDFRIKIDERKIRCKVDERFVSFAMSAGMFNKSLQGFDFGSPRLKTLLRALSPAVIRVGGSRANYMYFDETEERESEIAEKDPGNRPPGSTITVNVNGGTSSGNNLPNDTEMQSQQQMQQQSENGPKWTPDAIRRKVQKMEKISAFKDYVISKEDFDDVYNLVNDTGNTLLYDLSAFPRNGQLAVEETKWKTKNAAKLLTYAKKMNYDIMWQLGNEPNHYKSFNTPEVNRELSGAQVKNDYNDLKQLLKRLGGKKAKIVGPDVTRPKGLGDKVDQWLSDFLQTPGDPVDYLSWHQYYVDGRDAKPEDFINPLVLDQFVKQNRLMKIIRRKNDFKKPVWITETGSAWGGGAKDLSNRFAGVFPWVDKLGVAGENCIQVVARQSLFSGNYQLIEKATLSPHPEYFASVLFKRLVSNQVVNVNLSKESRKFRVYARCAKTYRGTLPGSLVLIVINLYNMEKSFDVTDYELFDVQQYLMTAQDLRSDVVKLNGIPLGMNAGDKLPPMPMKLVKQPVTIPPRSVGYYVLDKVNLEIC